jgi:hypothetical protein
MAIDRRRISASSGDRSATVSTLPNKCSAWLATYWIAPRRPTIFAVTFYVLQKAPGTRSERLVPAVPVAVRSALSGRPWRPSWQRCSAGAPKRSQRAVGEWTCV